MSDDFLFFTPHFIRLKVPLSVKFGNWGHKQGLIYSIQSLFSQKHPKAIRSFRSIGLQWNKFEFSAKQMSRSDHISH